MKRSKATINIAIARWLIPSLKLSNPQLHPYTRTLVDHRGPDSADTVEVTLDDAHLLFHGAVLWHQGTQLAQQPLVHNENVLLWNGDLYDDQDFGALSDSDCVMRALDACSTEADVFQAFTNMTGPYSVIYLNKSARKLYFGRDVLGRHSLLLAVCENGDLVIGSVLGRQKFYLDKCLTHRGSRI